MHHALPAPKHPAWFGFILHQVAGTLAGAGPFDLNNNRRYNDFNG